MRPLFPFLAGLATGAAAIMLLKNKNPQATLEDATKKLKQQSDLAQDALRQAAVSGLNAIEASSARLRDHLQTTPDAPAPDTTTQAASAGK